MATYVISDIHGQYDMFMELLEKIHLEESDTLYILGDVLDRGPNPIKTLRKIMEMPNVICIVGNHELMALECLERLLNVITKKSRDDMEQDEIFIENFATWEINGSETTRNEFYQLKMQDRLEVLEFIKDFLMYEEVTVNDTDYLLVHAGLGNYEPGKDIEDYNLHDLVWFRPDYNVQYFPDTYVITGHTPTQVIEGNPRPGYIFRKNKHIAIDCGAFLPGGRLAAICLDTGEEFYSSTNETEN